MPISRKLAPGAVVRTPRPRAAGIAAPLTAWLLSLILLCTGCKRESPFFHVSFDGTMRSNSGLQPRGAAAPDFRGYLKRKDVRIKASQFWTYELREPSLQQGTAQMWIKLHSPADSFHFLSADRVLSVSIVNGKPHLRTEKQEFEAANTITCDGKWRLLTMIWKGGAVRFFTDADPVSLTEVSVTTATAPQSEIKIGVWSDEALPSNFALGVRDLSLWNNELKQKEIASTYEASIRAEQKTTWRAVDLFHFCGKAIPDSSATSRVVWTTDSQFAAWPNVSVPQTGEYEVVWRLKPHGEIPPYSIWSSVRPASATSRDFIALKNNTAADLSADNSYQDFAFKFRADARVPLHLELGVKNLDANVALDTVTIRQDDKWKIQRRGEELQHTVGSWKTDPEAQSGRAWGTKNTLLYGPYACIGQPGRYRANWRVKVSRDLEAKNEILALDVFAHDAFVRHNFRHNRTYARAGFPLTEFHPGEWETKSLEFKYDGADMMEFRAFSRLTNPAAIEIDSISVEKIR